MQTIERSVTSLLNCCSAAVAAGAIALAMMSIAAPAATAEPKNPKPAPISEGTIKKQCQDPDLGGTYGSTDIGGVRVSTCDYLDGDGKYCSDQYKNGVFQGTNCGRVAPPVDPRQPLPGDPALSPEQQAPPPVGAQPLPPGGGSATPR